MNFTVAFLISISMNYATKLSTGCRQICRCCGTRTDRQIWIKLRYLLSYCRFLSTPYSRLFNAAQDLELTVQLFTLEGGIVGVVPVVACEGVQNRPPRTKSPSRYRTTLQCGEKRQKYPPAPSRVGWGNLLVFQIDGKVLHIVQCGTHYGDF